MRRKYPFGFLLFFVLLILGTACSSLQENQVDGGSTDPEMLIEAYIHSQYPDLAEDFPIAVKEFPLEDPDLTTPVRVFRITEGPYEKETFLIDEGTVVRLGTSFGGQGLTSLVVTDLDDDQVPELIFTYSFGSGIHQSRVGMYAPAYDAGQVHEAAFAYQGDLGLVENGTSVELRIIETDWELKTIRYLDAIGTVELDRSNGESRVFVQLAEDLPSEISKRIMQVPAGTTNQ